MGVILQLLPKKIEMSQISTGFDMSENSMNNFTSPLGIGMGKVVELPQSEITVPVCKCGCNGVGECCNPPKGLFAKRRYKRAMKKGDFRNFSLVSFLYTPNVPGDFAPFSGNEFKNCCGL